MTAFLCQSYLNKVVGFFLMCQVFKTSYQCYSFGEFSEQAYFSNPLLIYCIFIAVLHLSLAFYCSLFHLGRPNAATSDNHLSCLCWSIWVPELTLNWFLFPYCLSLPLSLTYPQFLYICLSGHLQETHGPLCCYAF